MRIGPGIFIMTAGAIMLVAIRTGSPHWFHYRTAGVILILAGAIALALPRLAGTRADRFRRRVVPGQARVPGKAPPDPAVYHGHPALVQDSSVRDDNPTLAGEILSRKGDPPL